MNIKTVSGLILMAPFCAAILYAMYFQLDNPDMTQTRVFMEIGYWSVLTLIPFIAGAVLFHAGQDDDD